MNDLIKEWRNTSTEDKILSRDLESPDSELEKSFKTNMEFGTAGIRGLMGAGTNKMNEFTVAAAARAYAQFLLDKGTASKGVVVGHDNRHNSKLFSEISAKILMANGIRAYLYESNELQPTPLVSFTIRNMDLDGGVIITASHNPKEYNGFKVYDSRGRQLLEGDTKMIQGIMKDLNPLSINRSKDTPLVVSEDVIKTYKQKILKLRKGNDASNIKVVFSAQHGTSAVLVPQLLKEMGAVVVEVTSQQNPDPDFSNTITPNPEDRRAYDKAIELAKEVNADLILTTDPDADRIGMVVNTEEGFKFMNGNESAAVYLNFLLNNSEIKDTEAKYIVSTYVSGTLPMKIAQDKGIKTIKTHVGFKNIAAQVEKIGFKDYIFGYEESYGCLIDPSIARDKDALQACVAYADMASYFKAKGTNAYKEYLALESKYGNHRTIQKSIVVDEEELKSILNNISDISNVGDRSVSKILDFRKDGVLFIRVELEDGSSFSVRPSGTEPKVKIYMETIGKDDEEVSRKQKEVEELFN